MNFHDSTNKYLDDAADLVRSLSELLKYSNYYRDIPRVSDATLDNLRRFDNLLLEASSITRRYLNTTVPINRCPDEILSSIFALSATETLPAYSFAHARVPFAVAQKLRPIISVCRSWRNVALSTPSLWCDVVFDKRWRMDVTSRCLALAKTVPLRIHARYSQNASSDDIMRMIKESGNCVKEAYLRLDDLGWDEIIDGLPTRPPLLKHLTIAGGYSTRRSHTDGKHYFGGLAQKLQRFYVRGAHCLPTDKFPNLTHFVAVLTGESYTLHTILSVLSNMPRIEVTILTVYIQEDSVAQCDKDTIVEPTHLRLFALKDCNLPSVRSLLPMIKFPSTCLVQIDGRMQQDLVSIVGLLYKQDFAQNLTRLRIMPDRIYNDGDEDNEDSLYFLELFNDAGTGGLSLGIRELFSGLWTANDRTRVTDALLQLLSSFAGAKLVSSIEELWIHNWTDLVNDRLLAIIPPVHTLGLALARPPYVRTEIPGSLGLLTEDGALGRCPNLTSLYVYTCGAEDIDRARMVASARKDAGHPLHRLAIECENAKEEPGAPSRARELKGLVHELSVTVGKKRRGWWKPCSIPEGWSRHGSCPWPDWQE